MDISFSTSWTDGDITRLLEILPHVDFIEVGSKGTSDFFKEIEEAVSQLGVRVTSIHAVAGPHKEEHAASYTPNFASGDLTLQGKDIDAVRLTAEWAVKIGAGNIVLHVGKIADEALRELFLEYKALVVKQGSTAGLLDLRKEIVDRRADHKDHLDSVVFGLERLCRSFPEINFCFETRLHYYEIPIPDEAEYIFNRLQLPNLGYWHDIGHTWTLDRLGFIPMNEWQMRFGEKCRGVHVHDTDSSFVDHYPPGFGSMDLESILSTGKGGLFDPDCLLTLEINRRYTKEEVITGIANLRDTCVPV